MVSYGWSIITIIILHGYGDMKTEIFRSRLTTLTFRGHMTSSAT